MNANALATALVDTLRSLREAQLREHSYRELFLLSLALLGEREARIKAQDRTIARLHEERRALRKVA